MYVCMYVLLVKFALKIRTKLALFLLIAFRQSLP